MTNYFIRRFLLMIPTFIGITMLVFAILQYCPGNIVDQEIERIQSGGSTGGESGGSGRFMGGVKDIEKLRRQLEKQYGFDRPIYIQYGEWLWKVCQGDLGISYRKKQPVSTLIGNRLPVSIKLGLIGFFLSYMICIPLGVFKAIKHGSTFDFTSSVVIFIAYTIPGWALGVILLVWLGGGLGIVPLGGLYSANHAELSFWGRVWDQVHHGLLPIFCYTLANFASLTILMKNSLMENLGADYIRTAFAKGLSEKRVIFVHCLRNSMIPIATGLGHALSLILAGSYLIEKVFNVPGFGLLGFNSITNRDYPLALGILVIASVLKLLGNIISDMLYCIFDPRIRFK